MLVNTNHYKSMLVIHTLIKYQPIYLLEKFIDTVLASLEDLSQAKVIQANCVYLSAYYLIAKGDVMKVNLILILYYIYSLVPIPCYPIIQDYPVVHVSRRFLYM